MFLWVGLIGYLELLVAACVEYELTSEDEVVSLIIVVISLQACALCLGTEDLICASAVTLFWTLLRNCSQNKSSNLGLVTNQ